MPAAMAVSKDDVLVTTTTVIAAGKKNNTQPNGWSLDPAPAAGVVPATGTGGLNLCAKVRR